MSARLLGAAFTADMGSMARKLVLLKLVDECRDDGSKIFPSISTIARAAQCKDRQVQRELAAFRAIGLLTIVRAGGRGRGSTTEYRLNVSLLERLAREGWDAVVATAHGHDEASSKGVSETPLDGAKGVIDDAKGVRGDTQPLSKYPLNVEREAGAGARHRDEQAEEAQETDAAPRPAGSDADQGFEAAWRTWPSRVVDDREAAHREWRALDEAQQRRATDRIGAWLDEHARLGRGRTIGFAKYLRQRKFDEVGGKPALERTAAAAAAPFAEIAAPFSESWWSRLHVRMNRGEPVRFMIDEAKAGRGIATDGTGAGEPLVPADRDSEAVHLWCERLARVGARLRPADIAAPTVWLPRAVAGSSSEPAGADRGGGIRSLGDLGGLPLRKHTRKISSGGRV